MAYNGIDIRATGDRLIFDALLADATGALVTSGTTTLKLYKLATNGTLTSYDFADNTFKATALTTETANMTHQLGNNGTTDTGLWTYALTTLTGFEVEDIIYALVENALAFPAIQIRKMQYGGADADITVSGGLVEVDAVAISASTLTADRLELALPTDNGIDIDMGQTLPGVPVAASTGEALTRADGVNAITSGFTTTSPQTLYGHLRALMHSGASTPTGLGTYTAADHSNEALRLRQGVMSGAGFTGSTDSLQAIRDAIDVLIAPQIVSVSSSGSGMISDCISNVRQAVDEPSTAPKYSNSDILRFIRDAFDVIITDLNTETDHPVLVRYSLSVAEGKQTYTLPPNVAQVRRVAKIDTATTLPIWEVWPTSEMSFHGRGFWLEGNTLRLGLPWTAGETMEILYIPNSEVAFHKATASAVTDSSLTFPAVVTDGTLDLRKNAYAGYLIRVLEADTGVGQEILVKDYDSATRVATLAEDWEVTPTGTVVYEAVPQYQRLLQSVVCLRAAIDILGNEGNTKRMQAQTSVLQVKMAALRRQLANKMGRFPGYLDGDTIDNENRGPFFGEGLF